MDENYNYSYRPGGAPNPAPVYTAPGAGPAYTAPGGAPMYTAPANGYMYAAPAPAPKKSPLVPLLIVAAVVVVAICAAVFFITRNSATSVAERYILASCENCKAAVALRAFDENAYYLADYDGDEEAFFETMSDTYDADITSWNEYYKASDTYWKELRMELYGKHKMTVKTLKSRDISIKRALEENERLVKDLEDSINFDTNQISDAKLVTVSLKIAGEDETIRSTHKVYVVKIGLSWRVLAQHYIDD